MRFLYRMIFVAALLMLVWLPFAAVAGQNVQGSAPVAKVGNLLITQEDVDRRAQDILPMQANFHGGVSAEKIAEIKQKALDELVARAYKVQYAIDDEISIDAGVLESEWQKKLSKNKRLSDNAQTPPALKIKADLYLNLLANKAEAVAVDGKVMVSEQEVSAYYEENKTTYFRPTLFTASHVFVRVDPASNAEEIEEIRARADALYKRALAGEDFYDLAYYESDDRSKFVGGSLGSFHAGQTVPAFDEAIQDLEPGDISEPVRTIYGFHIIRLDDKDSERQLEFNEVATKIRSSLKEAVRKQLYEQWMSDLKTKYPLQLLAQ